MNHNVLTRGITDAIGKLEATLTVKDPEFEKFRKIIYNATKVIVINWPLWTHSY